jgi:hypothetical protein
VKGPSTKTPIGIFCRKCNYDLQGQVGGEQRCPECGGQFDAGDKKTFRRKPLRAAWLRWTRRVAVGLIGIVMMLGATWGWLYWGWKSEQNAVENLKLDAFYVEQEPLGGRTLRDYLGPMGWVLERVRGVYMLGRATDADLGQIKALKGVQLLDLNSSMVTDVGLENLKELKVLQSLNLSFTQVTNAGMEHLNALKGLRELDLHDTQVTDAGLENLKNLKRLQKVNLCGTWVTDAGLEYLKSLKGLEYIDLNSTQVTMAGMRELQAALPGAEIVPFILDR